LRRRRSRSSIVEGPSVVILSMGSRFDQSSW
jgi:hypothetical protein